MQGQCLTQQENAVVHIEDICMGLRGECGEWKLVVEPILINATTRYVTLSPLSTFFFSILLSPTDKDNSLRNGLLVFFFLVLPLLIAAALAFARRDRLKRWFRRLMSRCHS